MSTVDDAEGFADTPPITAQYAYRWGYSLEEECFTVILDLKAPRGMYRVQAWSLGRRTAVEKEAAGGGVISVPFVARVGQEIRATLMFADTVTDTMWCKAKSTKCPHCGGDLSEAS